MRETVYTDICVIGGGSGGVGAALAAARHGVKVIIVEKEGMLGGTSTVSGVNCWEPGISSLHFDYELYKSLKKIPDAICIGKTKKFYTADKPWGFSVEDKESGYFSSVQRAGKNGKDLRRVHFEAENMALSMEKLLLKNKNLKILYNTLFLETEVTDNNIISISVIVQERGIGRLLKIEAKTYIDCSGDIIVARSCGCKTSIGEDAKSCYGELNAPDEKTKKVNGVSLIFRATPSKEQYIDEVPGWVKEMNVNSWLEQAILRGTGTSINQYPNGDLNLNILPVMSGEEYLDLSEQTAYRICMARTYLFWNYLQKDKGFNKYHVKYFFKELGVRESYRLAGKFVLTENDIRKGMFRQRRKEEIIVFADHAMDVHKTENSSCRELDIPYGIPYDCLLTNEVENLMVACRGSSFTHRAASSVRLSRTMISIGEAAGMAASMAIKENISIHNLNINMLRNKLEVEKTIEFIEKAWKIKK